jgi:ribosomal protein S18 acetylase RimI-like enzyme
VFGCGSRSATYLVAWRGPTPLGSGMIQWTGCQGGSARSSHPDCIEINHLQVRPELRGSGARSALITAAEELIQSRGYAEAGIGVSSDNPRAASLYRRLGYRSTGVLDACSSTWVDTSGTAHEETEVDELLVKLMSAPA